LLVRTLVNNDGDNERGEGKFRLRQNNFQPAFQPNLVAKPADWGRKTVDTHSFFSDFGACRPSFAVVSAIMLAFAIMVGFTAPVQAQSTASFGTARAASGSEDLRGLFASWQQNDRQRQGVMAIPSARPVEGFRLTSSFGTRSDPFRATRRMHNGLDMAGPIGTPIHATADGIVGRAQWVNGYGNYIEINHGGDIQTRYGHMSELLVSQGARVTRGQLIGRMGSTGRSTGSHLHYEVRIEGHPVNPTPFLASGEYLASLRSTTVPAETQLALGASQ